MSAQGDSPNAEFLINADDACFVKVELGKLCVGTKIQDIWVPWYSGDTIAVQKRDKNNTEYNIEFPDSDKRSAGELPFLIVDVDDDKSQGLFEFLDNKYREGSGKWLYPEVPQKRGCIIGKSISVYWEKTYLTSNGYNKLYPGGRTRAPRFKSHFYENPYLITRISAL